MSRRTERVNELLRDHISTVLARDINDPRIDGIVTITAVETSRDLAHARIWVSVAGEQEDAQRTLQGLRSASGFLQRGLMRLGLRRTPELNFVIDDTIARADRINQLLDSVSPGEQPSGLANGEKRGKH
ncbi:MAG: 30S ribosome-binding factor RbfA [Dehalococcoidia bacterium]|nr:30S ribosome-binding factor RbfA [Dehalococcoidia bacterium]